MTRSLKLVVLVAVFALIAAACGDSSDDTTAATSADTAAPAGGDDLVVGVSWNNYNEERWAKSDEPAIKAALDAAGVGYISTDAGSSVEQQLADIEQLISQGADALIILAQDGVAVKPGVESALAQGIPVIAYDRLIEDPGAFYITFDNVEVGRMQARVIFDLVPEGNYVFIKGNSADANADFLRGGQQEILQAAIDSGAIVNVGESYTDNWDPAVAQTNMEQFLTQNNNEVDAVVASNDGMAGGVVAALAAQGLDGIVQVSGQDGDGAALNRVALGTQAVSVWKDARELGKAAGEAAVALAQGSAMGDVAGSIVFDTPGGNAMNSILLPPIPITQANLDVVLDADWITAEALCQGVEAGSVPVC
ncbi:MAG: substrate-binding domain-containing protein [Acidimicrobiia bacterium]|nr:substrate-binding domain-containing protein [Acidimicrobiia bacterium]